MSLLPDWLLVCMTAGACCALIFGRWRTAALLAAPAAMRFLVWPLAVHYGQSLPPLLIAAALLVALPFILLRILRRLLILGSSEAAADHALGHALGKGLAAMVKRPRRPKP